MPSSPQLAFITLTLTYEEQRMVLTALSLRASHLQEGPNQPVDDVLAKKYANLVRKITAAAD